MSDADSQTIFAVVSIVGCLGVWGLAALLLAIDEYRLGRRRAAARAALFATQTGGKTR